MAFLDPVNTIATKRIIPGVADIVFKNSPLLAFFRKNSLMPYYGGPSWQENAMYDLLPPVSYNVGDSFDISQKQIATGLTVTPRYYNVPVSAYIEKLKVEMNGLESVFSYVDLLLQNAALALSAKLSNDLYRNGQGLGSIAASNINGLDEVLNDGSTNGFLGVSYPNYLTVARTSLNSNMNSPMTSPAASVSGVISYPLLEQAFSSVVVGPEHPDLIVTSNLGWSYIKMAFQPQQAFMNEVDPDFGFQTVKFNGANIIPDQYAPGSRTATAADTLVGFASIAGGETIWFLNTRSFRLYVSTDPLFGFGFTGFLPAQNNSTVAGHYKFCGNFTGQNPRYSRYLFNVTG